MRCNTIRFAVAAALASIPVSAAIFEVGPNKAYTNIGSVPWGSLGPGDQVLIYWKSDVYREKFYIGRSGAPGNPIVVRGVPNAYGVLPVIDGYNAVPPPTPSFWNEDRGVVKIGGGDGVEVPSYITIELLDIRGAKSGNPFRLTNGVTTTYIENAAGVFVERGTNITVRRCVLRENGDGIFVAGGDNYQARDILIERNLFRDNGYLGSDQHHNTYVNAINVVFQYNKLIMHANQQGNNLKDRSTNAVYRYNWIEGGNRQLDLVQAYAANIRNAGVYHDTWAYGNVLIDYSGYDNAQIVHFGGDSPDRDTFRQGTLYFYNNTVASYRGDETILIRISHPNGKADIRNNVVYAPNAPLRIGDANGTFNITNNWLQSGWTNFTTSAVPGVVNNLGGNISGTNPGFVNAASGSLDPRLTANSPAINAGAFLHNLLPREHYLAREYVATAFGQGRRRDGLFDLGAFEYSGAQTEFQIALLQ